MYLLPVVIFCIISLCSLFFNIVLLYSTCLKVIHNSSSKTCLLLLLNVNAYFFFFSSIRQLNLLSTATPAVGAWLVPIDQVKSSLNKLETEGTLRICAVMGCIMTEALEVNEVVLCWTQNQPLQQSPM